MRGSSGYQHQGKLGPASSPPGRDYGTADVPDCDCLLGDADVTRPRMAISGGNFASLRRLLGSGYSPKELPDLAQSRGGFRCLGDKSRTVRFRGLVTDVTGGSAPGNGVSSASAAFDTRLIWGPVSFGFVLVADRAQSSLRESRVLLESLLSREGWWSTPDPARLRRIRWPGQFSSPNRTRGFRIAAAAIRRRYRSQYHCLVGRGLYFCLWFSL